MSRKEYDLIKLTIDEIHAARSKIKQEAADRTRAEELAILERARAATVEKPIYLLVAEPGYEDFDRCFSLEFDDILKHLKAEILYCYPPKQQAAAIEEVDKLTNKSPTPKKPLHFQLPKSEHGSYPYMIKCITADDFIKQVKSTLKYKDDYLSSLSRCSCAGWDD
ncbi:MAG: hypothetical protein AAB701_01180 [Patescibacteria group bacterium]